MRELMRQWIDTVLCEGRTFTLTDSPRKLLADPSRSDIMQLLKQAPVLRGVVAKQPDSENYLILVWKAYLISHWNVLNDLLNHQGYEPKYVSFKVGVSEESLREDKFWRDAQVNDCGEYFVAFSTEGGLKPHSIPKVANLFGPKA